MVVGFTLSWMGINNQFGNKHPFFQVKMCCFWIDLKNDDDEDYYRFSLCCADAEMEDSQKWNNLYHYARA